MTEAEEKNWNGAVFVDGCRFRARRRAWDCGADEEDARWWGSVVWMAAGRDLMLGAQLSAADEVVADERSRTARLTYRGLCADALTEPFMASVVRSARLAGATVTLRLMA